MGAEGRGGRRRRRRGEPTLVGDLLAGSARSVGVAPAMAALISDPEAWRLTVGTDLAASGEPVRCTDGELVIVARDSIGETRLRYAAEVLREAVNDSVGHEEVSRVVVRRR